ncbi:MAG: carboxypeptidase-like regulatory domain-containing protein, partial [Proteiniphilum sp.]
MTKSSVLLKPQHFYLLAFFLLFSLFRVAAQNVELIGNVKDVHGETLIGVNVVQKGTSNGTVTDLDGNFIIRVPADATLV